MNTILLQKILDILTEGLAHVGDFFKDLFVSDPQDGQVIGYDGDTGKWTNIDITDLSFDLTNNAGPAEIITITDAAANMPVKSLTVDIVPKQASGTPTPDNPLPISGSDEVVITHTYGDNITDTHTIALPSTVYGGEVDVVNGNGKKLTDIYTVTGEETSVQILQGTNNNGYRIGILLVGATNKYSGLHSSVSENANVLNANTWQINKFCIYSGRLYITVPDDYDTVEKALTYLKDGMFEYELATPIEYTLTPTQIKTNGGTESIWSDTGDVSGVYYTTTAGTIKDLVTITEDITSQVTKNTTDFSDILLKVSQNNKVVSVEIYNATTAAAVNDTFLSGLPKPAMNCKVLLVNTTLGEDGTILGTLKTSGELEIATSGAKSFSGLITYVAK